MCGGGGMVCACGWVCVPTLFFCMLSPLLFPSHPPQQHIHVYVHTVNVPHAYKRDGPFASATDKCRLFSSLKEVRVLLCVRYSLPCLSGCSYVCLPARLPLLSSLSLSVFFFFSFFRLSSFSPLSSPSPLLYRYTFTTHTHFSPHHNRSLETKQH